MTKKLILVMILALAVLSFAGVYVESGKVVFTFEVDANQVYLAGNFNNWLPDSLAMENENGIWKISLELQPGEYQYKFVIDGTKWVEDPEAPSYVDDGFGGKNGAFLLIEENGVLVIKAVGEESPGTKIKYEINENREDTIYVDEEGYIIIRYYNPEAEYVMIAGNFNDWDPESLEMYEAGDGWWEAVLELEPGIYEYKFVINGENWIEDPNAFAYVDDGFGGKNSVLAVYEEDSKLIVSAPREEQSEVETASIEIPLGVSVIDGKVYFKVEKKEATKAYLAGTFNNWDPQSIEMKNVNGYWQVSLELNPGKYQYKFVFIINDNQTWQEDPFAPGYVPDGFGGKNGIFELVEQDGSLVILKPEETSSQSSSSLSGNYSFTLTYKYDQDIILKGYGFDNSLNLIFKPSDELEFSLKYSGATIDNAKLEFSWQKLNLMAHYNLPLDLAIEGISSGVFVNYDNKFFVDIGALNDVLPFLLWVRFGDFSVYYGNKYFYGENAIFAGYDFEFSSIDFELFGGYFVESSNFAISINTNSKNWNSEFSYVNNIISLNIDVYGWEIFGNYSMLDSSYEISLSAPLFEIYKIFGGYRHSSLIDKSHIGFGLFEDDYSLRLKIRTEASNIFLDIFGEINF